MSLRLELTDVDATEHLGRRLADRLPERAVVHLYGELGAGKSTLARALLRHLGVQGPIRSPTYTLIERYATTAGEVAHLDLYRIADPEELYFLGLDDLAVSARLWLIEWPERGGGAVPPADLELSLAIEGSGRIALLVPRSEAGRLWLGPMGS
jgi:tRNA threonylcarbamoyladenosine biosynthesis protein TsaE